jgi:transposase
VRRRLFHPGRTRVVTFACIGYASRSNRPINDRGLPPPKIRNTCRPLHAGQDYPESDLSGIKTLGIDEIAVWRGHRYLTLVYQIDSHCRRLLWVGEKRTIKTLFRFFRWFGPARSQAVDFICSDMWKPYLKVTAKKAGQAVHILDRFHIMAHLSKAIDEVRAQETKELKDKGYEPILSKTRGLLLKRPENLTDKQESRLADLLRYNLRSIRSYLLKEEFQLLWSYASPDWAGRFLDNWCTDHALQGRTREKGRQDAEASPATVVELVPRQRRDLQRRGRGFNKNKARLTTGKALGFRPYHAMEIALHHALGALPEPPFTHRVC